MAVKKTRDSMTPSLKKLNKQLGKIAKVAYEHFRKITPKRSGNAQRRTILRKNTIVLQYPYGKRLDTGWSKQARKGMSKPTLKYLKSRKRQLLRKR